MLPPEAYSLILPPIPLQKWEHNLRMLKIKLKRNLYGQVLKIKRINLAIE
jgi:hypothetical protein